MRATVKADVPRPLRMGDGLPVAAQGGVRAAHAGMGVAVAGAGSRHIDGKDQRRAAGGFGALQRIAHKAAVAQDIQLEPHRALDGRGDLFDRADGNGREGERNAFVVRRAGGLHFAAAGVHPAQPDRRQRRRHRQLLVE